MLRVFTIILFCSLIISAQIDTTKYPWPIPSFNSSKNLNATFGEFRNTGNSDHFHNAVDIGEPDGNPVYPCINGSVYSLSNNGYDSYINVKSIINGKKKHITYYHVVPNPSISIGQSVVARNTVIGTIYNGAAHVHLIERELLDQNNSSIGNEINPIRPEGGLNPYIDTYPPIINSSSLKFYKDGTSIPIASQELNGKVDIRIDVREQNGPTYSNSNNGTYILGYRILSMDGSSITFEPENQGIKYRFYYIPSDSYVHQVFVKNVATLSDPIYWLTNGNGEEEINNTLIVKNSFFDTDLLDDGTYLLEIFSEDTRSNKASKRFPITIKKLPPELLSVESKKDSIFIKWSIYSLNSLMGYRIYYSDLDENNWQLAADESMLDESINEIAFGKNENFLVPTIKSELKFYLTAVDSSGIESNRSDIYSLTITKTTETNILIVDGFDRYGGSGSWPESSHEFNIFYTSSINHSNEGIQISSCANEAVIKDFVNLKDYDIVVWFLGDESIEDNTLSNIEQYQIALYLEDGGKLFISGEDIGQDLDTKHNYNEFSDTLFYHQYLKSILKHDGIETLYEVNGAEGTNFEGLNVPFGHIYPSDAPDDIEPINGALPIFNYTYMRDNTTFRKGGIAYNGIFGNGVDFGSLVYISFPFETIGDVEIRNELMSRVLEYLKPGLTDLTLENSQIPQKFNLEQNYPNPFNPMTTIKYSVPDVETVHEISLQLKIYDVLGREIFTLADEKQSPGYYTVLFDGSNLSSGIYFYRLISKNYSESKKMILLK